MFKEKNTFYSHYKEVPRAKCPHHFCSLSIFSSPTPDKMGNGYGLTESCTDLLPEANWNYDQIIESRLNNQLKTSWREK